MGADLLPPDRYLRNGAQPPILQATWEVSICLSSDKAAISPEIEEVKLVPMVTWELGLSLREDSEDSRGRGEDGGTQSPAHHGGKNGSPRSPGNYGGVVTVELCGFWFLYRWWEEGSMSR